MVEAELLLLNIERSQLRWIGRLARIPSTCLPEDLLWPCPSGRRHLADLGHAWSGYISLLALVSFLEGRGGERLGLPAEAASVRDPEDNGPYCENLPSPVFF